MVNQIFVLHYCTVMLSSSCANLAGPTLGALVLASTVTVIVLLGSTDESGEKSNHKNQYSNLNLYETFLVNTVNILKTNQM